MPQSQDIQVSIPAFPLTLYVLLGKLGTVPLSQFFIYFFKFIYLFVFIFGCVGSSSLVHGLSLAAVSGGYSSLRCADFSLSWLLMWQSTGSRHVGFSSCGTQTQQLWLSGSGSVVVAHGLSCSAACGIFPGQGSNPCPLHWQADS